MDTEAKLSVFQEFLDCSGLMLWHYDENMRLISGTEDDEFFQTLQGVGGSREMIHHYCQSHTLPGFCSDSASLLWLTVPRYASDVLADIYVIGPVFGSATSEKTLEAALRRMQFPSRVIRDAAKILKRIPTVQHTLLIQYGVMLYRCLTDVKLDAADFELITSENTRKEHPGDGEYTVISRDGTYAIETAIFQAVEDGNMDYRHPPEAMHKSVGALSSGDPLRHAKNQIIAAVSLMTRAAIRGGMPETSAYSLSDWYIRMVEACGDVAEVYQLSRDAFEDFTRRVHKYKLLARSREIQECMSYIELHFQENIRLEALAAELGYSKNYLCTKFSQETDMSIGDYLTQVRMERAALWLKNSDRTIQEISHDLGYSSLSYFSSVFKKQMGLTPSEYRNQI